MDFKFEQSKTEWGCGVSWAALKEWTKYAVFAGRDGILMVTDEGNEHALIGVRVYVTYDGKLGAVKGETMGKEYMHKRVERGGGYLTRRYDQAILDHIEACRDQKPSPGGATVYGKGKKRNYGG